MNWWQIILSVLSSSLFTGLITTYVSYRLQKGFNDKKLNAEIVSKARIDWINEVRKISAQYIFSCNKCLMLKRKDKRNIDLRRRLIRDINNGNKPANTFYKSKIRDYEKRLLKLIRDTKKNMHYWLKKNITKFIFY